MVYQWKSAKKLVVLTTGKTLEFTGKTVVIPMISICKESAICNSILFYSILCFGTVRQFMLLSVSKMVDTDKYPVWTMIAAAYW